jgi:hypothetical protein
MTQYKHAREYRVVTEDRVPESTVSDRRHLKSNEYDLPVESWASLEQRRLTAARMTAATTASWKTPPTVTTKPPAVPAILKPRQSALAQKSLQVNTNRQMAASIQRLGIQSWAQHYENASDFQAQQQTRASKGEPLNPVLKAALEAHFNQTLPEILIHTDEVANERAEQFGAIAFTKGSSIFFRRGAFQPFDLEGFKLLVHETTHVIQQASGVVPEGVDSSESLERDAQVEAGKILSVPSQRAKLEQPAQLAARLKTMLKETENPALRFETVAKEFASVPPEFQAKTRTLLMQGFNPRSSEYGRLEGSLIVSKAPENQNVRFSVARETGNLETRFNPIHENTNTKTIQRQDAGNTKTKRRVVQERLNQGSPGQFIRAQPAADYVVPGTTVNYQLDTPPMFVPSGWQDPRRYQWKVINDPASVKDHWFRSATFTGPNKPVWNDATWDFEGNHKLELTVTEKDGSELVIEYTVKVTTLEKLADDTHKQTQSSNFTSFRTNLEMRSLEAGNYGVKDQSAASTISSNGSNPARQASYISPANPPPSYTYSIKPKEGAKRWNWYVEVADWNLMPTKELFGFKTKTINGKLVYEMHGSGASADFVIANPNTYTIVCEEFDASGKVLNTARYRQVVMTSDQEKIVDAAKKYTQDIDAAIKGIQDGKDVALKAVLVEETTANKMPLNLFIGPDAKNPKAFRLVDLTPGAEHRNFTGGSVGAVFDSFDSGNEYPKGQIVLEVPANQMGVPALKKSIKTDGSTSLSTWAARGGMASLGLALVGGALLFTGVGAVAAPYFFVAAGVAGAASGAASIANELNKDHPNPVNISVDVLMIAGSILGAGAAAGEIRAGVQASRALGQSATQAERQAAKLASRGQFITTKMGKFLVYTGFSADAGMGVLIGAQGVSAIDTIIGDANLSREEKISRITRILAVLAVQAGLLAYGAKNLKGSSGAAREAEAAEGKGGAQVVTGEQGTVKTPTGVPAVKAETVVPTYKSTPEQLKILGDGKTTTAKVFTVGNNDEWMFTKNPKNWVPARQQLHNELLERAERDAAAFAEASEKANVGKGDAAPTIFAMRGNTAAGKSRSIKGNIPELEAPVDATKSRQHMAVNPDNFKVDLYKTQPDVALTSSQVHQESSMLASWLEKRLLGLKTQSGKTGSMLIDKRLATAADVQSYADMAKQTGRKLNLYDVDAPLEVSLAGVLERRPGGNDPIPPFEVIGKGFTEIRNNRKAVIQIFENNPQLGKYELFATSPQGGKVAEVVNGKLVVIEEKVFKAITADATGISEAIAQRIIKKELINEMTMALDPKRAADVKKILEPWIGKTWQEALEAHSKAIK